MMNIPEPRVFTGKQFPATISGHCNGSPMIIVRIKNTARRISVKIVVPYLVINAICDHDCHDYRTSQRQDTV